ncbi:MAG: hypothetical protein BMS9Abin19_0845 [Gammaproteobacteria bacterium]|nr:MAG: hypothetical protein BMS9Abin19_0845 [Gammaproteobacteria bacterium]
MFTNRWLILCFSLLCTSYVNAETSEQWQFAITPVLWNASVEANLTGNDTGGQPIKPDYTFFSLENLDAYLSLQFEAKYGRFSLLFDSLRARYQDDIANRFSKISVGSELGFIELTAAYKLFDRHKLDLLGGVRKTFLDMDISLVPNNTNLLPSPGKESSSSWTDPLIGLRYNYSLTDNWQLWLRGDVGGFGVGTQRTINALANIQYIFNKYVSLTAGYRYLQIDFKEEDVLNDVKLEGVYLGVGIHF